MMMMLNMVVVDDGMTTGVTRTGDGGRGDGYSVQVRVMKSIRQHGFGSGSVRWLGSVDSVNSPSQPSQLSQQMGSGSTQCTSPRLSPTRFRLGVFWFDSVKLVDSASRLGQLCIST
ncbi:hypothetical protein HanHA300_Chr07g0235681 [Helianthus annuus]|nr:hypothetical protein HanHA300_Chr07g0235681 [Helianthus annuus]KAJ0562559.1 hypothetical protein HanHA89_Chr07g0252861 [Helianthus annuus]KAJ0727933.1 hypothetical protein HanLR1_Chr07g0235611 [Helianthus annuus]KAJ0730715.1 hypothetical protein HanOQP8_Chr07g0243411 [Helianthus annuus]